MSNKGKVIVIGGGVAGLSTAWALRRRGFAVDVFEQGPLPNPRASSYDEHRITRHAYGELEGYARLMPEAFALWEMLWADLGARHVDPAPMVYVMRGASPWHEASIRSLDALGIGWREIPLSSIPRRHPMIEMEGLTGAVETQGAGILFPIRILTDLVVWLAASGVRLHAGSLVTDVDPEAGTATADGRKHHADVITVAAGAWTNRLVPSTRGRAVPSRQATIFVAPPPELAAAWAASPVLIDIGEESGSYTLPPRAGTRLKIGDHRFTLRGDPDDDRAATDADIAQVMASARLAYRDFDKYTILERKACYYMATADERFLIEPLGARGWFVSACSGHGFKLGPLMGEGLARAVAGEQGAAQTAEWAAGRL